MFLILNNMEDLGIFSEKVLIDKDTEGAINNEIANAYKLVNIDRSLSPRETVRSIREYVDVILDEGSLLDKNDSELRDLSVTLGALWGDRVCKEYGWSWLGLKEDFDEYPAFYVISPNNRYCIPAFGFIYNIINKKNEGLDGNNDNTILLLFNMLDGIETRDTEHPYTVLG